MRVSIAGKGGVGKTTLAAALARELARRGTRVLAVDCDPNPNLAESFGLDSGELHHFGRDGLRRAGHTLELAHEPTLAEVDGVSLLGGPPGHDALPDAVARGIAGVLLADRFEWVITDLGAGPELTRVAVGGVLNPADVCVVLSNGGGVAELTADRIAEACRARDVPALRLVGTPERLERRVGELAGRLFGVSRDVSAGSGPWPPL